MEKYLYLTKVQWVKAWIKGGKIPILLASTYLYDKRDGILTPDENLIHESPVDLKSLSPAIHFSEVKKLSFINSYINGQRVPDIINANYYIEDGLILSFCNSYSKDIARRLSKKACVKILSMEKLKDQIDKQLGCEGIMKKCEYTNDHQRNHFLKSREDAWQDEFRIFWKTTTSKWVNVPEGIAEFIAEFE
jgi:hypothetical protein